MALRDRSRSRDQFTAPICITGCGFYGAIATEGYCSACYASKNPSLLENDKTKGILPGSCAPECLPDLQKCKKLSDGESFQFQGDEEDYTLKNAGGHVYCTCPSWRYQKKQPSSRTCKHIRMYLNAHNMSPADAGISLVDRPLTCGPLADGASLEVTEEQEVYKLEYSDGLLHCSCPAWLYQQKYSDTRTCKHVRAFLEEHGLSAIQGGLFLDGRPPKCGSLADGETVEIQGASNVYSLIYEDGFLRCTCPAWQYQRLASDARTCKHVESYLSEHGLSYDQAGLCIDANALIKSNAPGSPARKKRSPARSSPQQASTSQSVASIGFGGPVVDRALAESAQYHVFQDKHGPWDTALVSDAGDICILQLLQHHSGSVFSVWVRHGPSENGNSNLTRALALADGKAEFERRFYDMTCNHWNFGKAFVGNPGKYVLLGMP